MNAEVYLHDYKSVELVPFGKILREFFKSLRVDNRALAQEPGDRNYFYHFTLNLLNNMDPTRMLKVTLLPD